MLKKFLPALMHNKRNNFQSLPSLLSIVQKACYSTSDVSDQHVPTASGNSSGYVKNPITGEEIEGLIYVPNYLSHDEGSKLLSTLDNHSWYDSLLSRRIQCYGIHYYFTKLFHPGLQPMRKSPLLLDELSFVSKPVERDFGINFMKDEEIKGLDEYYENSNDPSSFEWEAPSLEQVIDDRINQCLVQEYYEQSIAKHVDNVKVFGKEIVCLSLVNECQMDFESANNPDMKFKLTLEPNSLLIMSKEGRYDWKHGIKRKKRFPRRISLTFRHLLYYPALNQQSTTGLNLQ
ncbi:predicted protein [Naegleria gruberi]|uniref:Predicted protein n=1 Tax=Naegleria gruberi TaxID=5762 RepID=D2VV84_NAEGR|nr:uncharacterized protein NAEGRDRAFT_72926 [Naegleria gruberi]EFC39266.1 predicted protein [Naegleria gruberi]|eukprot:XP_002672010.1 predicted protein [Naegleria gruberi strain NEG-M]